MVSRRKKKNQQKKQLTQLNGTSVNFVIGKGTNVSAMENETIKRQTLGHYNDFERIVDRAS